MSDDNKPTVELFVKAAPYDVSQFGGSLMDHEWFMTLYCLVEKGVINLRLTPVCLDVPPENYANICPARQFPVAHIEYNSKSDGVCRDDIEELLCKLGYPFLNPDIDLPQIRAAEKVFESLFNRSMSYFKNDLFKPFLSSLTSLNEFLASANPYIFGEQISYLDCKLICRLQHMREVGRCCKNFHIPVEMNNIYRYLAHFYRLPAFMETCPITRVLLKHYENKVSFPAGTRVALLDSDIYTEIPSECTENGDNQES